jgi:hypothetical protein
MTEERKHAILFATTLLCARKIIDVIDTNAAERMGKKFCLENSCASCRCGIAGVRFADGWKVAAIRR